MTLLVIGLILFLGAHSVRIVADGWRDQMVARLGPTAWKGISAGVSLVGLVLIVKGYALTRLDPIVLWQPPYWISHLVSLLMLVSMILLVAAYVPRNKIKSKVKHPMVVGVKVWAFSHLLANGAMADLVLFGAFLVWAILDFRSARQRDRSQLSLAAPGNLVNTLIAVVVGAAVWAWFVFQGHAWLIGVRPLVMG